ncbi:hypothetical protein KXD40_007261 [Peronospora effusa]|nr:hypothetical protein KXD40_007261 [Peronospora effusa]
MVSIDSKKQLMSLVMVIGVKSWKGHVNRVPGGGLVGVGKFTMEFLSVGFEEFRNHVRPLLEHSRALHRQFCDLTSPSVLLVPGTRQEGDAKRLVYCSVEDPMTLFLVDKVPPSADH